jgi:D-glycero-alpha-D-manno-heptose-7-phosphate kinase
MLAAAFRASDRETARADLASIARDLEARILRIPTGTQDHLAAIHGGLSRIHFGEGAPRREALPGAREIEARGVLCFLGASRASSTANWDMVRRALDGDPGTRRAMEAIACISEAMARAMAAGRFEECGRLIAEEWKERRALSPKVSTEKTEFALGAAMAAGAYGGKICGAGGGGCLFVLAPPEARSGVETALRAAACEILEFRIEDQGVVVEVIGD